jgi:hypothetical protein
MFKPYQNVMLLCIRDLGGGFYDMKGRYIKEGSNNKHVVEINTVQINVDLDQICDYEEYFKAYHGDKSKLPPRSTGQLWFLEK